MPIYKIVPLKPPQLLSLSTRIGTHLHTQMQVVFYLNKGCDSLMGSTCVYYKVTTGFLSVYIQLNIWTLILKEYYLIKQVNILPEHSMRKLYNCIVKCEPHKFIHPYIRILINVLRKLAFRGFRDAISIFVACSTGKRNIFVNCKE